MVPIDEGKTTRAACTIANSLYRVMCSLDNVEQLSNIFHIDAMQND